jgi:hypothetical protein
MKTLWTHEAGWTRRAEEMAKAGDHFEVRGFEYVRHIGTYAYLSVKYRMRARYDPLTHTATFQPVENGFVKGSKPVAVSAAAKIEFPAFR